MQLGQGERDLKTQRQVKLVWVFCLWTLGRHWGFWSLGILKLLDAMKGAGFWTLGILPIFGVIENSLDVRDTFLFWT